MDIMQTGINLVMKVTPDRLLLPTLFIIGGTVLLPLYGIFYTWSKLKPISYEKRFGQFEDSMFS